MGKWKANKLPIMGCPICIGDTFYRGEKCAHCQGYGYFPEKSNQSVSTSTINDALSKNIQDGNTIKC